MQISSIEVNGQARIAMVEAVSYTHLDVYKRQHVACVITYGAYSYFSAVVIFDIYNYELFNALYAAMAILIYAIFD